MLTEKVAFRFIGGPLHGDTRFATDLPWPPPERVATKLGREDWAIADATTLAEDQLASADAIYYLTNHSKLPPQDEKSLLMRGAEYSFTDPNEGD